MTDLACSVSAVDRGTPQWTELPRAVREEIETLLKAFAFIAPARFLQRACKEQAARMNLPGFSWVTLRKKFYEYRACADWRVLINRAKHPETIRVPVLTNEFWDFWFSVCLMGQRGKVKSAHRRLLARLARWRAGDKSAAIPGYDAPPPNAPGFSYPAGWSYQNLNARQRKPNKLERTAACIGRQAAREFALPVLATRVGREVGEVFYFDDQVHDVTIRFPGNQQRLERPLEFTSLDYFSGALVLHGFKPVTWDAEMEHRVKLRQEDFVWFLIQHLYTLGYRPAGTLYTCELGTAAAPAWYQENLAKLTAAIRFESGAVDRRAVIPGCFESPGRGNFKVKAPLESIFNLVRNVFDGLPGQVGMNRDHAPEEQAALERYEGKLILASMGMTPELAREIRHTHFTLDRFREVAMGLYHQINRRGEIDGWDHNLEGWTEAGLLVHEWRPLAAMPDGAPMPWIKREALDAMDPAQRERMLALIAANPVDLSRVRKMSPWEVWQDGRERLVRPPWSWLVSLLPPEPPYARAVKVLDNQTITFKDSALDDEPIQYVAEAFREEDGSSELLRSGDKFLAFPVPHPDAPLVLMKANGSYVGLAPRWTRASTREQLRARMATARRMEERRLAPVVEAGRALTKEREDNARVNEMVLRQAGAGLRVEEKRGRGEEEQGGAVSGPQFSNDGPCAEDLL